MLSQFKARVHLKAVYPPISCLRFKQSKNSMLKTRIYVLRCFVNFWVILRDVGEEIVFLKGFVKFRELEKLEILCHFKITI